MASNIFSTVTRSSCYVTSKVFSRHKIKCLYVKGIKWLHLGRLSSGLENSSASNSASQMNDTSQTTPSIPSYLASSNLDVFRELQESMSVVKDFISEYEEHKLMLEIQPYMKRLRYEFDHWDNAIHGYRETEKLKWKNENEVIIKRVRDLAFPPGVRQLQYVHVLDLSEEGVIKPHVDSIRFCGNTIAGLSLLSDAVMRLAREKDPSLYADVLLPRRSLYIMKGCARYNYTHAVLGNKESFFKGNPVPKTRRVSVICRNEPEDDDVNSS